MSEAMSQDSDDLSDSGAGESDDDGDMDMDHYYDYEGEDTDVDTRKEVDPEYFEFELLKTDDIDRLFNEHVEAVCKATGVTPALAKVLLYKQNWNIADLIQRYKENFDKLLADCRVIPAIKPKDTKVVSRNFVCPVCMCKTEPGVVVGLACGHMFCKDCWQMHFSVQIQNGCSTGLECMGKDCEVLVPEDFVLNIVVNSRVKEKYQDFTFNDQVNSHPELRFCPGPNCPIVVRATVLKAKRVICKECKSTFCFRCGTDYHAPTDCDTIKKWLTKCADDSETANYISAHTKDCPKCQVCIEKNGGCNHMQCTKCKHDFCWMCLGDWKNHGSEYYECSRYKENPNIANESANAQAREALKKYLFYFERWENHSKSLRLEEETTKKIRERIEDKVMNQSGTWIDWQYLLDAATLLRKCRYTLQYTYPYAYYLEKGARKQLDIPKVEKGARKQLFEYQQAQLEAEVENLSWKVERAEITDRGELENQMDIAEKRRLTLVRDFLDS
eukprot:GHVU01003721.1.p1 GENE.GHVU01003721.1~~GHVU01003721.1.p1  ORF type:complete len:501 (-),score=60.13 GHVU01003721.1:999-2501(-)